MKNGQSRKRVFFFLYGDKSGVHAFLHKVSFSIILFLHTYIFYIT